jgi:hypothetical protein
MGYKIKIQNTSWLIRPLVQVILYLLMYGIILSFFKDLDLISTNISLGITAKYCFYTFIFVSIIHSILLKSFKYNELLYSTILFIFYIVFVICFFGTSKFVVAFIVPLSIISYFGAYFFLKFFGGNVSH